jgi:hypothetical protein
MTNFNLKEMAKIAIDKKLCKEYHDASKGDDSFIVYLNDGDEFQIQLFNPLDKVIGVKINFKDEARNSNNLIVLRPGERVWLERFLDCNDKFKFGTYEVSNSSQVIEAIRNNGDLSVQFYYEDTTPSISISTPTFPSLEPMIYYSSTCDNICGNSQISSCVNTLYENTLGIASDVQGASTSAASYTYTTTTSADVNGNNTRSNATRHFASKSIETGRVEHGGVSNQNFKNVYYDFCLWPFATKYFKLLPTSRKQYSDSDLRKNYCTNCGKKLSPKFKYCPVCGEKVNS